MTLLERRSIYEYDAVRAEELANGRCRKYCTASASILCKSPYRTVHVLECVLIVHSIIIISPNDVAEWYSLNHGSVRHGASTGRLYSDPSKRSLPIAFPPPMALNTEQLSCLMFACIFVRAAEDSARPTARSS